MIFKGDYVIIGYRIVKITNFNKVKYFVFDALFVLIK